MSIEEWDVDQAVTRGPVDEDLDGCLAMERYGVTAREESLGEPLTVALAQEEPEEASDYDETWALVEPVTWGSPWRSAETAPEERALHLVQL